LTENDVHARIAQQVLSWFGDGAELEATDPEIRKLERSFFVRYNVKLGPKSTTVLLKVPRPREATTFLEALESQKPRPSTLKEYDMLVACQKRIGDVEPRIFSAIRPLEYFSEWNAIAMEELDSIPLSSKKFRLPRWNASDFSFEELLYRAGRWLRMFHHQLGTRADQAIDQSEIRAELEEKIWKLRKYNVSERKLDELRRLFHAKTRRAKVVVPFVDLHGDFKLSNILIDSAGRIASIDSKLRGRGPCYKDLAKLYADILGDRLAVFSRGLLNRPRRWKSVLLKGYFQSELWNESVFKIYTGLALIDKWIRDEQIAEKQSIQKKPARFWFRKYFFQLISKVLT